MAQPHHDPEDRAKHTEHEADRVGAYLLGAVGVSVATTVAVLIDLGAQVVPDQLQRLLVGVVITSWALWAIERAKGVVVRRLDRIEARVDERLTHAGEAEAFVDGLMRRQDGRVLHTV